MESGFCMKCGRELKTKAAFCDGCLEEMEKYPVKPGVVVLLPQRTPGAQKTPQRRRHPMIPVEEQVVKLKKRVIALTVALLLTIAAALAGGWFALEQFREMQTDAPLPGQNYSSDSGGQSGSAE